MRCLCVLFVQLVALAPVMAQSVAASTESLFWPQSWRRQEVGVGVVWFQRHFAELFGAPQNLNVLVVDPRRVRCDVVRAQPGRRRTSALAGQHRAIAAINGGYFKRNGAPVGLLQIDGQTRSPAPAEGQGALGVLANGNLRIGKPASGGWPGMEDALGAGPVLLQAGKDVAPREDRWHLAKRHPRTAAGLLDDGRLLLLIVDGRSKGNAAGMTIPELARVMSRLGCRDAVNLDGGGSTTMWLHGPHGVVNRPCDNRRFDSRGERKVGNALVFRGRLKRVLDDDDLRLMGASWQRSRAGNGYIGRGYALHAGGTPQSVVVPFVGLRPGRYRVELRVPVLDSAQQFSGEVVHRDRVRSYRLRSSNRAHWQRVATVTVRGDEEARLVLRGLAGRACLVDAVRLTEMGRRSL